MRILMRALLVWVGLCVHADAQVEWPRFTVIAPGSTAHVLISVDAETGGIRMQDMRVMPVPPRDPLEEISEFVAMDAVGVNDGTWCVNTSARRVVAQAVAFAGDTSLYIRLGGGVERIAPIENCGVHLRFTHAVQARSVMVLISNEVR